MQKRTENPSQTPGSTRMKTDNSEVTTKSFAYRINEELDRIEVDVKIDNHKHRITYEKDGDELKQTEHRLPHTMHENDRANIKGDRLTDILIARKKAEEIAEHYIKNL